MRAQPVLRVSTKAQEKLIAEAVAYVDTAVSSNAIDAAANRAAAYAGDQIWSRLTKGWTGRNCKGLARLARAALDGKDWLHGRIGALVEYLLLLLQAPRIVRLFGKEIARRFPLPLDHQLIVVARGMQLAGIVICALNGRDLAKCECFVDLVLREGKERVVQLLYRASGDWREFDQLLPTP